MRERQLELVLGNARGCRTGKLRHGRRSRSHEWFERMRQVAESGGRVGQTTAPKKKFEMDPA